MAITVAVMRSRGYTDLDAVRAAIHALHPDDRVVSRGARGVDRVVVQTARGIGLTVREFLVDQDDLARNGTFAFLRRNQQIVDAADRLIAFHDGESHGIRDLVDRARRKGIPVEIHRLDGSSETVAGIVPATTTSVDEGGEQWMW